MTRDWPGRSPSAESQWDFLDAVTSDPDLAMKLYDELKASLVGARAAAKSASQRADDWRVRFRDRDAYAKLLEAELRPFRQAEVEGSQGEQAVLA